jgi:hypothetical protein
LATNTQLPYCYDTHVNVHHNSITSNSSIGDELFSSTPAGAGGVTFCTGADYYKFNYNWLCGNLSTGDGGGLAQVGFVYHDASDPNRGIQHNSILFNQSTNPTIPTNGGGIIIMGAAPDGTPPGAAPGTECGSVTDADCAPGLSDGSGPGLLINANLIMGNGAESGSGGGIRLQSVNGTEVGFFPLRPLPVTTGPTVLRSPGWNSVTLTNNIITDNVAGWDGAGISLQDALITNVINNTLVSNDSTASAGVLFNTLGAPLASAPGATNQQTNSTHSAPQAAGLVTMRNSSLLTASLPFFLTCPSGHSNCRNFSNPLLFNNVFWENRTFFIGVGPLGTGSQNQQNVVSLFNSFVETPAASQPTTDSTAGNGNGSIVTGGTGACVTSVSYWDIGVRGDTAPNNHSSGLTLAPTYSVLTDANDYSGASLHNSGANPTMTSQYCNGSRTPPEFKSLGYQVPPGISDATVPNPIFNLTPAATVDEGNNWINISWGPLAEINPVTGTLLGNYAPATGSPAIDYIPTTGEGLPNGVSVPATDFFGNPRPFPNTRIDVGAVEFQAANSTPLATITPVVLNFGNVAVGGAANQTLTVSNPAGAPALTGLTVAPSGTGFSRPAGAAGGTCGTTVAGGATCTIIIRFSPAAGGEVNGNVAATASRTIDGSPVQLTGTGVAAPTLTSIVPNSGARGTSVQVTLTGTNFTTNGTSVTVTTPGSGITVSNVIVQGPTTITATFTISSTATLGAKNVRVTTVAGNTGTVAFTVVNPPAPTLTSISPTSAARPGFGTRSVPVTINGTNFTTGTTVAVSGSGVTVTGLSVNSSTQITATFRISSTATRSARSVTATNPGGTSGPVTFTVN